MSSSLDPRPLGSGTSETPRTPLSSQAAGQRIFLTFLSVVMTIVIFIISVMLGSDEEIMIGVLAGLLVISFFAIILFSLLRKMFIVVSPGEYRIFEDPWRGEIKLVESGFHFQSLARLFWIPVPNPIDGDLAWPLVGKLFEIDPPEVAVTTSLNNGRGTASGRVDIRMRTRVASRLTEANAQEFLIRTKQKSGWRGAQLFLNSAANEYVRSVVAKIDFDECTVRTVQDLLIKDKATLSAALAELNLEVETFVVESISFKLDLAKQQADQEEYELMRAKANQEIKAEMAEHEHAVRTKAAEVENQIKVAAARADAESQRLLKDLIGAAGISRIMCLKELSSALGSNTHVVSPGTLGALLGGPPGAGLGGIFADASSSATTDCPPSFVQVPSADQ